MWGRFTENVYLVILGSVPELHNEDMYSLCLSCTGTVCYVSWSTLSSTPVGPPIAL